MSYIYTWKIYERALSKREYRAACQWLNKALGINDWHHATEANVIKAIERYYLGGFEMYMLDTWGI
jgi:hypothetical protein